jgi:hypothetical protein
VPLNNSRKCVEALQKSTVLRKRVKLAFTTAIPDVYLVSNDIVTLKVCNSQVRNWWPSTKHYTSNMSKSKPTMRWNIVRKAKNSLYYLESVEFESACSGASVFEQIRRLCLPQRNILSYRLSSLLYSPVVYTTTVIKVRKLYSSSAQDLTSERDAIRLGARMSKPNLLYMKSS